MEWKVGRKGKREGGGEKRREGETAGWIGRNGLKLNLLNNNKKKI